MYDFASKEDYLAAFESELKTRGMGALSSSAVVRALDDAEENFETLLGRGKTPSSIAETLGSPKDRAEVVVAMRLLKHRPGSSHGPERVSYLRVIRALWIVSPLNLLVALLPTLVLMAIPVVVIVGAVIVTVMSLVSGGAFLARSGELESGRRALVTMQALGFMAGGVFAATVSVDLFHLCEFLAWKWARWNVNYLMREIA